MEEHRFDVADDHASAIDILFVLADAEAHWRDYERALDRLGDVEAAGYALPPEYELKRRSWELAADRALARG